MQINSNEKRKCSVIKINYIHKLSTREAQRSVAHGTHEKISLMIGMGLCLIKCIGKQKHGIDPTLGN